MSAALIAKKSNNLSDCHTGLYCTSGKKIKEYLNTEEVGLLGGGKENLNGIILDVAIINSLATEVSSYYPKLFNNC